MATLAGKSYRFGAFEVNAAANELLYEGRRVKLQEQPLRLLIVLLETPGEVVSRADLQKRIWPENTFVDFDSSLRVAIRKLREALGDDAEHPRYIETIPKVGYRFVGPSALLLEAPSQPEVQAPSASNERALLSKPDRPFTTRANPFRLLIAGLIAGLVAMTVLLAVWLRFAPHPRVLTATDSVVIAGFSNATGDPVFDETLRQGLTVELGQSPFLSILPEERILQELKFMGQPDGVRLTPGFAREICQRTASAAMFEGSIVRLGNQFVLGLTATDCKTGQVMDQEQVQAVNKEDVLRALSVIARRMRIRVGESLRTVEEHDTPLAEATTSSLEALKAYSMGLEVRSQQGDAAALPLFRRAAQIEPRFAMAYAQLGLAYGSMGESDLSAFNTSRAYELRDRSSDAEKFFITASYESRVTGNLVKARETCEEWSQAFPREATPHAYLAGFIYPALAKYEQAVEEAQKAISLRPDTAIARLVLAYNYVALGRLQEAKDTLRAAKEHKLEVPEGEVLGYTIAFIEGDAEAMKRTAALQEKAAGLEDWMVYNQASATAYGGHLREAMILARRAELASTQTSHPERAALFEVGSAVWQALYGDVNAARKDALAALQLSKDREVLYGVAFVFARTGDSARSRLITNDLERRFPEDTSVQLSYLPTLRASLALDQGETTRALQLLEIASPYELGTHRSSIHGNFGALYPIYTRGEAYLAAHRGDEAATQFQKILDHRAVVISDPIGALAHLQIGRAYAMQGNQVKARAAYESFLALWKHADPELPVLEQARREYAKLPSASASTSGD